MKKMIFFFVGLVFIICSCNKESYFDVAVAYQNDVEYEEAIKYYKLAINRGEKVAVAEKNIGDIYFFKKKYEEAFEHYKNSLEIEADVALDKVIQFISYSDESIRIFSYRLFNEIRNENSRKKMFSCLSQILKSEEQNRVLDIIELISKINDFTPVAEDVIKLLDKDDLIIKQKLLPVLPKVAGIVVKLQYINKVIDLLNQDNEILKELAIDSLGNMFGWAQKSIPYLFRVAVEYPAYREKALQAIEKIGIPTKEQVVEVFSYIKDKPVEIKVEILERLGNKRAGAKSFIPDFLLFLNDDSEEVKQVVRKSLAKIGKAIPNSVPELIELLKNKNEEIVLRAIYELGDLEHDALQAIDSLEKISKDKNRKESLRDAAKVSLQKIQK